MARRMTLVFAALVAVVGITVTLASPASAQVGLPGFPDIGALLASIFGNFPAFLQNLLSALFDLLADIFGGCFIFCSS